MQYQTHNDRDIDISLTSLQGYITTTFNRLAELFGAPMSGDGYKVDAEWNIQFVDGTVATIYNWKNGQNYNGDLATQTRDIVDWNVGGRSRKAYELVAEIIEKR